MVGRGARPSPVLREATKTSAMMAVVVTEQLAFVTGRESPNVTLIPAKGRSGTANVDACFYARRANSAATCKKAGALAVRAPPSSITVFYRAAL